MMTPQRTSFSWNLVTKNLHGRELLRKKIHEKITKLEKHLKHFPPDTVHLQIALERHPKKPLHTAALALRVPSNILHSKKSAPDVIKAFDGAVRALFRELESLKAELRRETFWKRKERRDQLHQHKAAGFAAEPLSEGTGPQHIKDVVREFFQQHYPRLLRHAARHIRHDERVGDIPKGALDAPEIVDEVGRQVFGEARRKPRQMSWPLWFYHLVHEELRRQRRIFRRKQAEEVPLDVTQTLPEDAETAEGYDAEQPLDIIQQELQPPVVSAESLMPDPHAVPPDRTVTEKDMLEQLQHDMRNWPRPEREVFELYFVEGLEPEEVAMVTAQPLKKLREIIASVQRKLREQVLQQARL